MKFSRRKFPNSPHLTLTLLCFSILLSGCSIIDNISKSRRSQPLAPPISFLDLAESIETLTFNARIAIRSTMGDVAITADVNYAGMDTVIIHLKDPLRRKLATIRVVHDEYFLWLQRENRRLSGTQIPSDINNYPIPRLPIGDIAGLLIGRIEAENQNYTTILDRVGRLSQISRKSDSGFTIKYNNWKTVSDSCQFPTTITLTNNHDLYIEIHYSQFQLKLRKLG